jgi:hypothetical protein
MIRPDGQKLFARNLQAVGEVCAVSNGIGVISSGNEGAVGLMENQLVDGAVGAAAKLDMTGLGRWFIENLKRLAVPARVLLPNEVGEEDDIRGLGL